jgi:hypothetical protein
MGIWICGIYSPWKDEVSLVWTHANAIHLPQLLSFLLHKGEKGRISMLLSQQEIDAAPGS